MRIALQCQSPLLQQTLQLWLRDYTAPTNYEMIISDEQLRTNKPTFTIGYHSEQYAKDNNLVKNLYMPFTHEVLLDRVKIFYQKNCAVNDIKQDMDITINQAQKTPLDLAATPTLEQQIHTLFKEYSDKLTVLFDNHYRNK